MNMKKTLPLMLSAVLLAGCSAPVGESGAAAETYVQTTAEEAVEMMQSQQDYVILDVRTPEEYAEKHIPGAINVPNETIGKEKIAELPDKDQAIFVYCRSGNRSKQASEKLVALGYTNVIEFGGINSWTGETVSGK
ncbi:MAG: rhodanese-like domain-containing protein [Slackia faecicanis]|nr:rhodanese-like domain-containing protein [Slackia faecicanis]